MKLPYDYVAREVDKLYAKEFAENDTTSIDQHIAFIVSFIKACGWDEEEFTRAMWGFEPLETSNELN